MSIYNNQIQDYIEGLLDEQEKLAFEKEMLVDKTLKENVERQQYIQSTLEKHAQIEPDVAALKSILQSNKHTFSEKETSAQPKKKTLKYWLGTVSAAAAIVFILMVTGVFNTTDYGQLPQMTDYAVRGGQIENTYANAVTSFNGKKYDEAIVALKELKTESKYEAAAQYYLGLSYLAKEDYPQAVSSLKSTADGVSIHKDAATYFVGYAYYQSDDFSNAKLYLEKVSSANEYYKKATELLKKMD